MSECIHAVDDVESFQTMVLENERPVVVDFWAEWCGPCRTLAPIFERLAERHSPDVVFVKVNTEHAHEVAKRANIRSLPTMAFFWEGRVRDVIVGLRPEGQIEQTIQRLKKKTNGGFLSRLFKKKND